MVIRLEYLSLECLSLQWEDLKHNHHFYSINTFNITRWKEWSRFCPAIIIIILLMIITIVGMIIINGVMMVIIIIILTRLRRWTKVQAIGFLQLSPRELLVSSETSLRTTSKIMSSLRTTSRII